MHAFSSYRQAKEKFKALQLQQDINPTYSALPCWTVIHFHNPAIKFNVF